VFERMLGITLLVTFHHCLSVGALAIRRIVRFMFSGCEAMHAGNCVSKKLTASIFRVDQGE
jgi:hypothetical protein